MRVQKKMRIQLGVGGGGIIKLDVSFFECNFLAVLLQLF